MIVVGTRSEILLAQMKYILLSKQSRVIDGKSYREIISTGTLKQVAAKWFTRTDGEIYRHISDFDVLEKD